MQQFVQSCQLLSGKMPNVSAARLQDLLDKDLQKEGKLSHFFPVLMLHGDIFGLEGYSSGNINTIFSVSLFSKTPESLMVCRGERSIVD